MKGYITKTDKSKSLIKDKSMRIFCKLNYYDTELLFIFTVIW